MVQVTKNGIVLLIPRSAYEADYKNYGWKIKVGEKQEPKKELATPTKNIEEVKEVKKDKEEKQNKVIYSKKNKEK